MILGNAKDTPLNQFSGALPDMSSSVSDWFQRLTFSKVVKKVLEFEVVETLTDFDFMGVRQPLSPQKLMLKPEGQRQWKWQQIHAWPALQLVPDEVITFAGTPYRVMAKLDYQEYGYLEYHIMEDYTAATG